MNRYLAEMIATCKLAKKLELSEGDPGQVAVTKIGGVPLWPRGIERPKCSVGHPMSFFFQVLLSDVPDFGEDDTLFTFHYCLTCMREGASHYGVHDLEFQLKNRPVGHLGYGVQLFDSPGRLEPDAPDAPSGQVIPAQTVAFERRDEVMSSADYYGDGVYRGPEFPLRIPTVEEYWQRRSTQAEYPVDEGEFRDLDLPDFSNEACSKLGGWPSWYNYPDWLVCPHGNQFTFVGQLDFEALEDGPWGGGGRGFFWVCPPTCPDRVGEMVCQI